MTGAEIFSDGREERSRDVWREWNVVIITSIGTGIGLDGSIDGCVYGEGVVSVVFGIVCLDAVRTKDELQLHLIIDDKDGRPSLRSIT